jgi:hypothetical protein
VVVSSPSHDGFLCGEEMELGADAPVSLHRACASRFSTNFERQFESVGAGSYLGAMTTNTLTDAPTGAAGADGGDGGSQFPPPRMLAVARAVDEVVAGLGNSPAWAMSREEQRETLLLLDRIESRFAELGLRVLTAGHRNDIGAEAGATSTAAWLADRTRQTRARCHAAMRLAEALDERYDATRHALADGRINRDQAEVIVKAVDALTRDHDDLSPDTHARAETHLLDLASQFDAVQLRRLGKRLFEVVCPEAADRAEGDKLAKEEERARRSASLTMRDNGDGTVEGRFKLPTLHAALLKKALEVLTAPRRLGEARSDPETGKKAPYEVLLGHGFMELLEHHLNPAGLPSQGGSPFTLVITLGIDALTGGIGAATLETGERISAGEARRLACRAGIIPMVLDGDSAVLDMGRERRLFDRYQRIAMAHRFGGCAAESCDRPPAWTEAHHRKPWHQGGRTDLDDGIALCPPHHQMADRPEQWDMRSMPSGQVRFSRRQ